MEERLYEVVKTHNDACKAGCYEGKVPDDGWKDSPTEQVIGITIL